MNYAIVMAPFIIVIVFAFIFALLGVPPSPFEGIIAYFLIYLVFYVEKLEKGADNPDSTNEK